jgi:endonuclease YncB( thermonuclease family)
MGVMANQSRPRHFLWGIVLLLIFVGLRHYREQQSPNAPTPSSKGSVEWVHHRSCSLIDHPHNDGDSFLVRLPDGTQRQYRLYFVDAPESQFKRYRNGETNASRIAKQAQYFGITSEEAVAIGQEAKTVSLALLRSAPFDVITRNQQVYGSERHYAHVRVDQRYLDGLLVERGLARIYTEGADLPDGTPLKTHRDHLRSREDAAKTQNRGAWK